MADTGDAGNNPDPTDQALIERAQGGDAEAFGRLVERYEAPVAATVVGMLGPGPDADDVGQEVFIRLYESLDQFRGESSLETYLIRIAINLSLNEAKQQRRWYRRFLSRDEEENALPEPPVHGHHVIDSRERRELVHRAIQHLNPKHRAVIVLRLIDGYSTKETADLLDIPEGTVLSRLARAKDKLKMTLTPYIQSTGEE